MFIIFHILSHHHLASLLIYTLANMHWGALAPLNKAKIRCKGTTISLINRTLR